MSYNPAITGVFAQMLSQDTLNRNQDKERRKENDALVKGFMQMHQASPELQRILPVQDWGDVAPNQIKGWLQGLELQQGEQQRMQQQTQQQLAQQQAAQQQQAQQQALMQVLQGLGTNTPRTPQADYLQAMVGQGGGGQMDSKQIMEVLGGLAGPRAFDSNQYADTDILLAPTGNVINRDGGAGGEDRRAKQLESLMTRPLGGSLYQNTLRLGDYVVNTYEEDGSLKPGARQNPVAEAMLRQANALSQDLNGAPIFNPTGAKAAPKAAEAEADDGGLMGRWFGKGKGKQAAPVVAAGPGQTTVAPVDPLIQQAQQFIQQAQQQQGGGQAPAFGSVQEAEAARAQGYRGPAMIGGRRAMIE